jgi:hypothetical protein
MKLSVIVSLVGTLVTTVVYAQEFAIERFSFVGGTDRDSSGDGIYTVNGMMREAQPELLSAGIYEVRGGFRSLWSDIPPTDESTVIFDNTGDGGTSTGQQEVSGTTWLANKFCLGVQSYSLSSIALLLTFGGNIAPLPTDPVATVRLQIYSHDPLTGKPSAPTGPLMILDGETNPITFTNVASSFRRLVRWKPATPFTLSANLCYWAVLSVESGKVTAFVSNVVPVGAATTFGRSQSSDAGVTWQSAVLEDNRRMLIRGNKAEFEITGLELTADALKISFTSVPGQYYVVQSRSNLESGDWADIPETEVSGNGQNVQIPLARWISQSHQFYRISVRP